MRLALPVWNGRISPVLDVSRRLVVLSVDNGKIVARTDVTLETGDMGGVAAKVAELKIDTLICGAVSKPVSGMLAARGIRTIPFVAGDVEEVVAAYLAGRLPTAIFTMPGCCGQRRQGRGGRCRRNRGGMV